MTKRAYELGKRAEQSEQTGTQIHEACVALWHQMPINEITLDKVAEDAGVSVRTVIRKFGSKEGLLQACIERESERIIKQRDQAPVNDPDKALEILLQHYETDGHSILLAMQVEAQYPIAGELLDNGRKYHRNWCLRVFDAYLPGTESPQYQEILNAYVVATDIHVWKVLRLEQKLSRAQTKAVMGRLINALKPHNEGDAHAES